MCKDILEANNSVIFYTEDMGADLSDENTQVDLERMSLFVIPVTFRLLTTPNRAMDFDFRFAQKKAYLYYRFLWNLAYMNSIRGLRILANALSSLNNLGNVYYNLRDYKKAVMIYEACYETRCKILGKDHPDTLSSLNNLRIGYNMIRE